MTGFDVQLFQFGTSLQEFVDEIVSASISGDASRHSGETAVAGMQADAEYQYMDNFTDEDFKGSGERMWPMCALCTYELMQTWNVQQLLFVL